MPVILFFAGMLVMWVYSPSNADVGRHVMSLCGPDHPEESRPSYCPKYCR